MSKALEIKKLIVNCMRGKSFTIDFLDHTAILGTNGAGKGTILEAISWVLTGTPMYGDKISLFTKGDSFVSVTAHLSKDGKLYEVTRELKKTSSGSTSQIRVDHMQASQSDIDDILEMSQKCAKASVFPRTFITSERADKLKLLLSLSDKLLDSPTEQVPFTEYSSVLKEYSNMASSAEGVYKSLMEDIDTHKALLHKFEAYDREVSKSFFGSITAFVSKRIKKVFDDYGASGFFDAEEFGTLEKYLSIGNAEEVKRKIEELETLGDASAEIIDVATKNLTKVNAAVFDELARISDVFKTYGIDIEISKDENKVSLASVSYNGIQLAALSGKEQAEVSAAVHSAICNLVGIETPLFIENGESVVGESELQKILAGANQTIVCYVSDTPLAIDNGDGTCTVISTEQVICRSKLWQSRTVNFV